ncbi:MAG: 4Fe-4S dicluster domain-containing protein [bacterium]|nr:4Fe-4S dicluster domain-containing protein [bacterium]
MKRQKIRKALILISLLLFPITMNYLSPYLIIQGAFEHVVNGSFIVFCIMLISSMFLGRVWCGYLCPGGGAQECFAQVNEAPAKGGWRNNIKYVIWIIWITAIIVFYVLGKGDVRIDFFYMTDSGISVSEIANYMVYYLVLVLLTLPVMIHGRRAMCHYICWMAPFMVIGSSIGRFLHLPQLHIEADKSKCISCKKCNKACPMGLDVQSMVQAETTHKCTECIQCGACVDTCPKQAVNYKFTWRKS